MEIRLMSKEAKFKRIRRLKKWMRPLPRRSNIHKYPILKWFSETAYKRSYLWSFRGKNIIPALFWGVWIAMLPIVGLQMLVVLFLALWLRTNLPVMIALQWISNPFTMGPIYFADYQIGMVFFKLVGIEYDRNRMLNSEYKWSEFNFSDLIELIDTFPPMFVGGSIIGISLGVVAVFLYKAMVKIYKNDNAENNYY